MIISKAIINLMLPQHRISDVVLCIGGAFQNSVFYIIIRFIKLQLRRLLYFLGKYPLLTFLMHLSMDRASRATIAANMK